MYYGQLLVENQIICNEQNFSYHFAKVLHLQAQSISDIVHRSNSCNNRWWMVAKPKSRTIGDGRFTCIALDLKSSIKIAVIKFCMLLYTTFPHTAIKQSSIHGEYIHTYMYITHLYVGGLWIGCPESYPCVYLYFRLARYSLGDSTCVVPVRYEYHRQDSFWAGRWLI